MIANIDAKVYVPPHDSIEPAFASNNIPVFFGCDDKFLAHALTVIASLMAHASPGNNYDIMIVECGIPRARMAESVAWIGQYPNASLRFVDIGKMLASLDNADLRTTRHFSKAVYFRLLAQSIFSNYDKIAYLDADIVAFADIAEFYGQELEGNLLAACHDFVAEQQSLDNPRVADFWREELGKEPGEAYFLSGGAVLDLAQMRRLDVEAALLEKLRTINNPGLPDQDIMNAVMKRVKYLGCEWNYLDWMADPLEESQNFGRMNAASRELARHARNGIKIIHYAERKPWTIDYVGKNDAYYWKYAARTPFYQEVKAGLSADCTPLRLIARYAGLSLQALNHQFRERFCPVEQKEKYASRLHNTRMRRRAAIKHMRRTLPSLEFGQKPYGVPASPKNTTSYPL